VTEVDGIDDEDDGLWEWCSNSRRWIRFMMDASASCPYPQEHLYQCESCGYYERRKPTRSAVKKDKLLKGEL